MYEKITPKFVKECTDALEYYDNHGCLPWEKKRVLITLSNSTLDKLKGRNKSKTIENALKLLDKKRLCLISSPCLISPNSSCKYKP